MSNQQPNPVPRDLQEHLASGRVIPFVGAGVSRAITHVTTGAQVFPDWPGLLMGAADRLQEELHQPEASVVRGLLEQASPEYYEAAKRARARLGEAVWTAFLKEHLDVARSSINPESLALASAVWNLGSRLVITTNQDRVMRWASPEPSDPEIWDIESIAEQAGTLRQGGQPEKSTLWHLHGKIDNATHAIFTPDGYSRLYPSADAQPPTYAAALETLHIWLATHTFLFIGFSLTDAYLLQELHRTDHIFQGNIGPHYVLIVEAERERFAKLDIPSSVKPIFYPGHGEPLLELMRCMESIPSQSDEAPAHDAPPQETPAAPSADFDPANPVFFVPYPPKGEQVVGRKLSLMALHQQLTEGRRTAIGQTAAFQGLGGLGKTQLAVEYAYDYAAEYPNGVIWLSANQDIDAQLIEIAEKARWIAPESEHHYKLDIALQRLRTYSDCLIIFDNLDSEEQVKDYLPEPEASPHILVTSRNEQPGFTPVPLNTLNADDALTLLVQESGRELPIGSERQAAEAVATALGGLPLALELAGAYLNHRGMVSWEQYRDLLQTSLAPALPDAMLRRSFTKHETDIFATLRVDDILLEDVPLLGEVLDVLTWSAAAPMGTSLLAELLGVDGPNALIDALALGASLRILQPSPEPDRFAIHPLLREVRRRGTPLEERRAWVQAGCQSIGHWFEARRKGFANLIAFEAEIDHLAAWQGHAFAYVPAQSARLTLLQAYPFFYRRKYVDALQYVDQALQLHERTGGTDA